MPVSPCQCHRASVTVPVSPCQCHRASVTVTALAELVPLRLSARLPVVAGHCKPQVELLLSVEVWALPVPVPPQSRCQWRLHDALRRE